MKQYELKALISECVSEMIQENPELANEGFFKNLGNAVFGPDQKNDYAEFSKQHNAQADVHGMKEILERSLVKILKAAYRMGDKARMDRKDVTKVFRSAMTGVFNKANALEEEIE